MPLVACDISVSMDGYAAGPGQTREQPFGTIEHDRLHDWMFDPDAADESRLARGLLVCGSDCATGSANASTRTSPTQDSTRGQVARAGKSSADARQAPFHSTPVCR